MRDYLRGYPSILGLTGSRAQIDDAKHNFRVFARRSSPLPDDGGYDVPHSPIFWIPKAGSSRISTTPLM